MSAPSHRTAPTATLHHPHERNHPDPTASRKVFRSHAAPSGEAAMHTLLPARSASTHHAGARDSSTPRPLAARACSTRRTACSRPRETSTCIAWRSGLAGSRSCIHTVEPCPGGSTASSSPRVSKSSRADQPGHLAQGRRQGCRGAERRHGVRRCRTAVQDDPVVDAVGLEEVPPSLPAHEQTPAQLPDVPRPHSAGGTSEPRDPAGAWTGRGDPVAVPVVYEPARSNRTTSDFEIGVLDSSATASSGTSTLASG